MRSPPACIARIAIAPPAFDHIKAPRAVKADPDRSGPEISVDIRTFYVRMIRHLTTIETEVGLCASLILTKEGFMGKVARFLMTAGILLLAAALAWSAGGPGEKEAGKVIKIGYTAPFTGSAAEFGTNGWRGVQLALEEINAKGVKVGGQDLQGRDRPLRQQVRAHRGGGQHAQAGAGGQGRGRAGRPLQLLLPRHRPAGHRVQDPLASPSSAPPTTSPARARSTISACGPPWA